MMNIFIPRSYPLRLLSGALMAGALFTTSATLAACPDDAAIDAYVKEFSQRKLSKGFGNEISLEDAECAKRKLGKKLTLPLGALVGYKAAFTNPALQKRFGVDGPKWGYMYQRNISCRFRRASFS